MTKFLSQLSGEQEWDAFRTQIALERAIDDGDDINALPIFTASKLPSGIVAVVNDKRDDIIEFESAHLAAKYMISVIQDR